MGSFSWTICRGGPNVSVGVSVDACYVVYIFDVVVVG